MLYQEGKQTHKYVKLMIKILNMYCIREHPCRVFEPNLNNILSRNLIDMKYTQFKNVFNSRWGQP